jgi:flagellar biosynthesis/type III secretory pathway protein FliH
MDGYKDGYNVGKADAIRGVSKNYNKGMSKIKALASENYVSTYATGYDDGYKDGMRTK